MPDPLDALGRFDPGSPTDPTPAAEVRARGDRLRRRRHALGAVAAAVAVVAVAVPALSLTGGGERSIQPADPSPSVTEVDPSPGSGDPGRIPAGIDLRVGLPAENEDTTPVTQGPEGRSGVRGVCAAQEWPPGEESDRLVAEWTGLGIGDTRDLRLYADDAAASTQLQGIAQAADACGEPGSTASREGYTTRVRDVDAGDEAVLVEQSRDPIGTVTTTLAVRTGPAVLVSTHGVEGGPLQAGDPRSRAFLTDQQVLLDQLCVLSADGCGAPRASAEGPSSTPPGTGATAPGPAPGGDELSAGFPLAAGWDVSGASRVVGPTPQVGGDPRRPVETACGESVPVTGAVRLLAAQLRDARAPGERRLLVFRDAQEAVAFYGGLVAQYDACEQDEASTGVPRRVERRETAIGGSSTAVVLRQGRGPDASLEVRQLIRLGRAVLLDQRETSAGADEATLASRVDEQLRQADPVVRAMCTFTEAGCDPAS